MRQTQSKAEQFLEWAKDAPLIEVKAITESLSLILKIRDRYERGEPGSTVLIPAPRIGGNHTTAYDYPRKRGGRPKGSKNKPKEGAIGESN